MGGRGRASFGCAPQPASSDSDPASMPNDSGLIVLPPQEPVNLVLNAASFAQVTSAYYAPNSPGTQSFLAAASFHSFHSFRLAPS
jgi:hypothetical protein